MARAEPSSAVLRPDCQGVQDKENIHSLLGFTQGSAPLWLPKLLHLSF